MSMMRSLAAISVLAVPCCASAAPATCTPGPALHAVVGAPAFHVFDDCIDAEHQWLEIAAALTDSQLPARIAMDRLLRGLDAQVRHAMGRALPAHVQLCVFPAGTTGWKSASVGCIKRGYENEEAEGGRPEDDDDQPQLENHAPFSPVEEVRRLQGLFGSEFGKTRHPTVTADEASHTLKIVYPFVERGTDRWASHLTFVDAAVAFLSVAKRVYPPPTSLVTLDFVGTWNGKEALRVRLADAHAFLAMDPWAMRERLSHAGIALDPGRPRTPAQTQILER